MWGSPTRSVRKLTTSPVRLVVAGSSPGRSSRSRGRVGSGSGPDLAKAAAAAGGVGGGGRRRGLGEGGAPGGVLAGGKGGRRPQPLGPGVPGERGGPPVGG